MKIQFLNGNPRLSSTSAKAPRKKQSHLQYETTAEDEKRAKAIIDGMKQAEVSVNKLQSTLLKIHREMHKGTRLPCTKAKTSEAIGLNAALKALINPDDIENFIDLLRDVADGFEYDLKDMRALWK